MFISGGPHLDDTVDNTVRRDGLGAIEYTSTWIIPDTCETKRSSLVSTGGADGLILAGKHE